MTIKQLKEHKPDKYKGMNFDIFSWTIDEVINSLGEVMVYLTKEFANKHAP